MASWLCARSRDPTLGLPPDHVIWVGIVFTFQQSFDSLKAPTSPKTNRTMSAAMHSSESQPPVLVHQNEDDKVDNHQVRPGSLAAKIIGCWDRMDEAFDHARRELEKSCYVPELDEEVDEDSQPAAAPANTEILAMLKRLLDGQEHTRKVLHELRNDVQSVQESTESTNENVDETRKVLCRQISENPRLSQIDATLNTVIGTLATSAEMQTQMAKHLQDVDDRRAALKPIDGLSQELTLRIVEKYTEVAADKEYVGIRKLWPAIPMELSLPENVMEDPPTTMRAATTALIQMLKALSETRHHPTIRYGAKRINTSDVLMGRKLRQGVGERLENLKTQPKPSKSKKRK
ncbi:hypothetical protein DFJ77DRAFT_443819 [Powellomyces hirtus]|nr:hypothetical protein DFJ77DRAFT_443819 [Powellomyces hirtus]